MASDDKAPDTRIRHHTPSDAMGPSSISDDRTGAAGGRETHGNVKGLSHRDGEPEPADRDYAGQGGITGNRSPHPKPAPRP